MHNRRIILGVLHDNQRNRVIFDGHAGAVRRGTFTDVMERLSPASEADWWGVVGTFHTLRCKVRARYLGNNKWPDTPLLALEVQPQQQLPTRFPPESEVPWHITIAYYDPQRSREFRSVVDRYAEFQEYTLVGKIQGAMFELDKNRCPVGSDPELLALKRSDPYYHDRPLHISL